MENGSWINDFPQSTQGDWLKTVEKTLNGLPFDALRTTLYEGFETDPLYTSRESLDPGAFVPPGPCLNVHFMTGPTQADASDAVQIAMGAGAQGVMLGLGDGGLNWLQKCSDLKRLLEDAAASERQSQTHAEPSTRTNLDPRSIGYRVYCGGHLSDIAFFAATLPPAQAGFAGLDPISVIAAANEMPTSPEMALDDAVHAALHLEREYLRLVPFMASDAVWHGAGGSAVEELGFSLAAAVSYWRAMTQADFPVAQAASKIAFQLTATSNIFLTIAKFRAARLLWGRAVEIACGTGPAELAHVLAQTSPRELSRYDRHVNILRGTAASFGAMTGGADAVAVLPFEAANGGSLLSQRLARNTPVILQQEAHTRAVADAGRGSFAIENLTAQLCEKAWALFCEVEAQGGMLQSLQKGFVRERLNAVAGKRFKRISTREDKITGVSAYPNPSESVEPVAPAWARGEAPTVPNLKLPPSGTPERFAAMVDAARNGVTRSELRAAASLPSEPILYPMPPGQHAGEPFEILRHSADSACYRIGVRPPVFIAVVGSMKGASQRIAWISAFLTSAGLEAVVAENGFQNAIAAVDAFRMSACPVVCLCGSEASLSSIRGVAHALRKAGARAIYLAALPPVLSMLDPLDAACVSRLLYEGCNAVAILNEIHRVLRVGDLASGALDDNDARDADFLS